MSAIFSEAFLTVFLVTMLASAMPLLLAAVGETVGQQSGVLGIGLEGMLLVGGYSGFAVTLASGSFWLGFLSGALAGALLASVMALLSVLLGANQIVVGIGITLAGTGVSSMLYEWRFADSRPRLGLADAWALPWLSELPVLGPAFFAQPGMFYVGLVLVVLVSLWLHRSAAGLRLRAAGQNATALDAAGGSVTLVRSFAVLFAGAMAGLGGAYLALVSAGTFTPGMTHGLGFLAIVVAMLGGGRVWRVALIALLYGLFIATGTALQLTSLSVPSDLIAIAPFAAVLLVLVIARGRSMLPPALATAYIRGSR